MTQSESVTVRVVDALDACKIPYFLSGSFASNFYGIPRSTKDADFVVQLRGTLGKEFEAQLGPDFLLDPQLSFETNTGTYRQLLHFTKKTFKVELFVLSQDEHDQSRFSRRRAVHLFERQIWVPTPEDVIISKLRWARAKDKEDARDVMAVQGAGLDWTYIEDWCKRHDTVSILNQIRQSLPDV